MADETDGNYAVKILITGSTGLLGRAVYEHFQRVGCKKNWKVYGVGHSRASGDHHKLDLTDANAVKDFVTQRLPINLIVHCAAERDCGKVDNDYEAAKKLNVDASENLARLAASVGAKIIYISTDYVFDGEDSNGYTELSHPRPLNKYGVSKLEGEEVVRKAHPDGHIILRVPLLYGSVLFTKESVVTSLIELFADVSKRVEISDYEIRFPTHVNDVAEVCLRLFEEALQDSSVNGAYHFTAHEPFTKYQMALVIAEKFNLPTNHLVAYKQPTQGPPRPYNSHLKTDKLEATIKQALPFTTFPDSIQRCFRNCEEDAKFQQCIASKKE